MKVTHVKKNVITTKTEVYYFNPCCHNMELAIHEEAYDILGCSAWDDLRRCVKGEIDKGNHSIIKYCPYCGTQLEWGEEYIKH
jgi:hypothetical protein